jgi:hypothetical protein
VSRFSALVRVRLRKIPSAITPARTKAPANHIAKGIGDAVSTGSPCAAIGSETRRNGSARNFAACAENVLVDFTRRFMFISVSSSATAIMPCSSQCSSSWRLAAALLFIGRTEHRERQELGFHWKGTFIAKTV